MSEHPPLGKTVIIGYSDNNSAYPILGVAKEHRTNQTPPEVGATTGLSTEAIAAWPNNKYTRSERISEERILWIYEILPGPTITRWEHDPETDTFISTSKTKDLLSNITPGIVSTAATTVTITTKEAIDAIVGYKVVTVIPKGDFYDEATAQVEYKLLPFEFPGYIMSGTVTGLGFIVFVDAYGTAVGTRKAASDTVLHTIKTWWEITTTAPTLTYDEITPDDIMLNGVQYRHVLHDELTRDYLGNSVTIPATVPSFTEYYGTADATNPFDPGTGTKWIGTARVIRGSVERAGSKYRFKVQKMIVTMK